VLAKRIIPCLDIMEGRVVKGFKFFDHRDAGDPVEQALEYDRQGADEVVFYDITASYEKRGLVLDLVSRVADQVFIPLTVGGGLRSVEDIRDSLRAGADKVSINTAAHLNPDLIRQGAEVFGSQCIVVAVDAKRNYRPRSPKRAEREGDHGDLWWEIYLNGGRTPTGMDALEVLRRAEELGAGEFVLNSMDADGAKMGYDIELTRRVAESSNLPVVASGGAGTLEHTYEVVAEGKADAVLAASVFHFRDYTVRDIKQYLRDRGVPVRL